MKLRIAAGGIHIESSTFTPYISGAADFRIREGETLLSRYPFAADFPDVELIPLMHAGALPGGVVSRDFVTWWKGAFTEKLKAVLEEGPLDGFLFDIHGAMSMEGSDDAEGELLRDIRALLGPDVCISVSMDLHGNVSDLLFANADLFTCYRTAPHIDEPETRRRAFAKLLEIIRRGRHGLVRTKVDLPLLLPGEKSSTEVEPGRRLYAMIPELEAEEGIADCALWMGYPWADQPRCHAAVVVSGYAPEKTEAAAMSLAEAVWQARGEFSFVAPAASPAKAIEEALSSPAKPFFISDTGDNPGAGGANDMVVFLRDFLPVHQAKAPHKKVLFASIKDEETVAEAYKRREGMPLAVRLGGRIDPSFGGPLELEVTVRRFYEDEASGKGVVLSAGAADIIVTSRRHQFGTKAYFQSAGVEAFTDYDIIVVKMGYLEPDLSRAAAGHVMALTPGAVDQNIESMPFKKLSAPLYPRQGDFEARLRPLTLHSPELS